MSTETVETAPTSAALVGVVVASSVPETLPGLDPDHEPDKTAVDLERAVLDTLDEYRSAGLLTRRDSGKVALAVHVCRVMADKQRRGRTSTYSNDARLLNEILDGFVAEEAGGDERLARAMAEWSAYVQGLSTGQAIAAAS